MTSPVRVSVRRRGDHFHASVFGHSEIWDQASTENEAVGRLIQTHPEVFPGIEVWTDARVEKEALVASVPGVGLNVGDVIQHQDVEYRVVKVILEDRIQGATECALIPTQT